VKFKITIDQKTYEVDVEAVEPDGPGPPRAYAVESAPLRVPAMPPPPSAGSVADEEKVARSPISGTVVRVLAQPGQSIQVGDVLLVLEAMKMQSTVYAPVDGTVAKKLANVGDKVEAKDLLLVLE
jgi:methylmalonyl-CoA carboxyltransferase 1.3S subunit